MMSNVTKWSVFQNPVTNVFHAIMVNSHAHELAKASSYAICMKVHDIFIHVLCIFHLKLSMKYISHVYNIPGLVSSLFYKATEKSIDD